MTPAATWAADTVLGAGVAEYDGRLVLRLRYRADVLDSDSAARIFGYYRTALELITADPGGRHGRQSLLSAEEIQYQIEGLAGPRRSLPERRFHEIFEEKVAEHPDAVAAVRGEREWTYRELNARANRLARALLARGLRREDVVAVVTERTLDWMAAVLAVFKAGGVYLPIEPHFPAGRIATTLSRAGCELVLTEPGAAGPLDAALGSLPGVQTLYIGDAYREDHADGDLGIPVGAGSAGLHLLHLGLHRGTQGRDVRARGHAQPPVRQDRRPGHRRRAGGRPDRAPVLRHLGVAAGLRAAGRRADPAGGQDVILDAERFVDTIARGRVNVLQVVPSYLEAVLSYLERHPRELPDLRYVSVTGEAVKKELTQRWFAACRGSGWSTRTG